MNELSDILAPLMLQATSLKQMGTIRGAVGIFYIYIQGLTGNTGLKNDEKLMRPIVFGLMDTIHQKAYNVAIV